MLALGNRDFAHAMRSLLVFGLCLAGFAFAKNILAGGPKPVITTQPQSTTVSNMGTASFSVTASSGTTLTYQWLKAGANISNQTNATLTITNAKLSDQASYTVQVINAGGTKTSDAATLTVLTAPTISAQPQSLLVSPNAAANFSVTAT